MQSHTNAVKITPHAQKTTNVTRMRQALFAAFEAKGIASYLHRTELSKKAKEDRQLGVEDVDHGCR